MSSCNSEQLGADLNDWGTWLSLVKAPSVIENWMICTCKIECEYGKIRDHIDFSLTHQTNPHKETNEWPTFRVGL